MNNVPLFIKVHIRGSEGMVNVSNIDCIAKCGDGTTYLYTTGGETPLYVDEPYEEIVKKLQNTAWII